MNRHKLTYLGLVSSIFILLCTAYAQESVERSHRANGRAPEARFLLPPPPTHQTSEAEQPTNLGHNPEQTELPLGSYFSAFPEAVSASTGYPYGGEFELTLLAGGKYRVLRSAFMDDSGTYTVSTDQIQFNNPLPSAALGSGCNSGTYHWQLQGNRLTLTPLAETCEIRRIQLTSNSFFRRDPAAKLWRQIGPEGGQINALLVNGNNLYAATSGNGVARSTDNGQSWTQSLGIGGYDTLALAAFNGNLLAGVNYGQIFISTDEGQTWTFTHTNGGNGSDVRDFAAIGANLFAATDGGGVLISTDGGRNWAKTNNGLTNLNVFALAVIGSNFFAGTVGGVFRSVDNGQSWGPINSGLSISNIRTLAVSGTRLFAGTAVSDGLNEVFVSENNGDAWRVFGNGLASFGTSGTAMEKLVISGDRVFATASGGLFINEAGAWRRTTFTSPITSLRGLAVTGNQLFTGSLFYGVHRSFDNGQNWNAANTGLRARNVWAVMKESGVLYAGMDDGLLSSPDEGQNWTHVNLGTTAAVKTLFSFPALPAFKNSNRLLAGADDGVYLSVNGQNWVHSRGLSSSVSQFAAIRTNLFAATFAAGVFHSSDGGQNWAAVNTGLTNLSVFALATIGENLFASTEGGGVFRSTNQGQSWTAVNTGLPRDSDGLIYVYAMAANGTNLFAGVIDEAMFRSTDNGQTWTRADRGLSPPFYLTLYAGGDNLYTSGDAGMGCFRSANNGQDWAPFNAGLDNRFVNSFSVSGASLYAATYGGGLYVSSSLVNQAVTVSAASFTPNLADKAIVAAFGSALATGRATATSLPLSATLAGTTVRVRDSLGIERAAPLFFASSGQINYQIPPGTAAGTATVIITNADGVSAISNFEVRVAASAIFTLNASGTGPAAAVDAFTGAAEPFNATQANGQPNIIVVFGTGLGGDATDIDGNVNADVVGRIDGNAVTVLYAGRAPGFTGLNQFNVVLPAGITAGTHTLTFARGGVTSNIVTLGIH